MSEKRRRKTQRGKLIIVTTGCVNSAVNGREGNFEIFIVYSIRIHIAHTNTSQIFIVDANPFIFHRLTPKMMMMMISILLYHPLEQGNLSLNIEIEKKTPQSRLTYWIWLDH